MLASAAMKGSCWRYFLLIFASTSLRELGQAIPYLLPPAMHLFVASEAKNEHDYTDCDRDEDFHLGDLS